MMASQFLLLPTGTSQGKLVHLKDLRNALEDKRLDTLFAEASQRAGMTKAQELNFTLWVLQSNEYHRSPFSVEDQDEEESVAMKIHFNQGMARLQSIYVERREHFEIDIEPLREELNSTSRSCGPTDGTWKAPQSSHFSPSQIERRTSHRGGGDSRVLEI